MVLIVCHSRLRAVSIADRVNGGEHAMQRAFQPAWPSVWRYRVSGTRGLALWRERGHPGVHGIVASRIVELIAKPFSPRGLLDRIRETLESAERGGERAA